MSSTWRRTWCHAPKPLSPLPLPARLWRPLQPRHAMHGSTACHARLARCILQIPHSCRSRLWVLSSSSLLLLSLLLDSFFAFPNPLHVWAREPGKQANCLLLFLILFFLVLFLFCPACKAPATLRHRRHHPLQLEPCLSFSSSSCRRCRCPSSSCPWHPHWEMDREVAIARPTGSSTAPQTSEWPARECLSGGGSLREPEGRRQRRQENQHLQLKELSLHAPLRLSRAKQNSHPFNLPLS